MFALGIANRITEQDSHDIQDSSGIISCKKQGGIMQRGRNVLIGRTSGASGVGGAYLSIHFGSLSIRLENSRIRTLGGKLPLPWGSDPLATPRILGLSA